MKAPTNTPQQLRRTDSETTIEVSDEPLFSYDEIESDFWRTDTPRIATAAGFAVGELILLIEHRRAAYGTTLEVEWRHIQSRSQLRGEINGPECERRRTAIRVVAELEQWRTMRAIENGEREPLTKSEAARWVLRGRQVMRRLEAWGTCTAMAN